MEDTSFSDFSELSRDLDLFRALEGSCEAPFPDVLEWGGLEELSLSFPELPFFSLSVEWPGDVPFLEGGLCGALDVSVEGACAALDVSGEGGSAALGVSVEGACAALDVSGEGGSAALGVSGEGACAALDASVEGASDGSIPSTSWLK